MSKEVFKVLSDKEHVLERPQMYVGSTTTTKNINYINGEMKVLEYPPALLKIINEIIDNCVDEAIRTKFRFGRNIEVTLNQSTGYITIEDDGRGLPQEEVKLVNGDYQPACVVAWTQTKAGSNFTDDRTTIGANGVGSSLTNFLSKKFFGTTRNGKLEYRVTCSNGDVVDIQKYPTKLNGTTITFVPRYEFFDSYPGLTDDLVMAIQERLESLLITFDKLRIKFNVIGADDRIKSETIKSPANQLKQADNNVFINNQSFLLNLESSEPIGFFFCGKSFVNGVVTSQMGHHVEYIIDGIFNEIRPMINKIHKVDITKSRFTEGLQILLALREFPNPKFSSQTKEFLINPPSEISNFFNGNIDFKKIAKQVIECEDIIQPIISQAVARYEAQEKRNLKKMEKAASKVKIPKHIPASKKNDSMLFLVEGDSAMSWFIPCRNPKTQGAYTLGGKVATTWDMKDADIMKNKVLSDILSILNLSVSDQSIDDMSYDHIGIFVDADPDGMGSIMPSLVAFFTRWPELFNQGRIHIIRSPLHIIGDDNNQTWFYTAEDFANYKGKITNHKYVKGLGQLEKHEYKRVIESKDHYVVKLDDDWSKSFELIYGKNADDRKTWIQGE